MPDSIDRSEGRGLFGLDAETYDEIRPPYPQQIYDLLTASGALREGAATLEIGAGSGLASRRLLELGANPLVVVEPDARFLTQLRSLAEGFEAVEVIGSAFEDARLPDARFDLVCAATSFHWIDPVPALARIAGLLKPEGHVALWWNVFGDPDRSDAFHEATQGLLSPLSESPSGRPKAIPFALDVEARRREFAASGGFDEPLFAMYKWTLVLDARQVGALYGTFSPVNRLPPAERSEMLAALMDIAEREFGGNVERNMISAIYLARTR
jgi:SAM-dependent methyltransferase